MLQKSTLDLPVSLPIRSVNLSLAKCVSPCGPQLSLQPSGVGGNLSDVHLFLFVGKNNAPKMPLTEHKLGYPLQP